VLVDLMLGDSSSSIGMSRPQENSTLVRSGRLEAPPPMESIGIEELAVYSGLNKAALTDEPNLIEF
jgi:hypothetical protein